MNRYLIANKAYRSHQSGVILPTVLIVFLVLSTIGLSLAALAFNRLNLTHRNTFAASSLLVAEAGAEFTLDQLNQNSGFTGYTDQVLFDNSIQGRGRYTTEVTNGTIDDEKIITSTGIVEYPSGSPSHTVTRKIRLLVVGTTTGGYAVQTGPGGLIMTNSATIANGNVNINGYLSMTNNSRIGSTTNPVNVSVAHYNCPAGGGSPYPSLCSSGQPITMNLGARIYGDVCATNQTNGSGMSNNGLIPGCTAPPVSLPTDHDREAQKITATNIMTSAEASCNGNDAITYPANTRITGNVTISNNCTVTVEGDVWVEGTFLMRNSSVIKVSDTATAAPIIMIDGNSTDFQNNAAILANSASTGFRFINYHSVASCSPDCSSLPSQQLHDSSTVPTINIENGSLAAGSSFYARWTKVTLSNNGSIGQLLGQTIQLSNSGNISFGSELSSGESVWSVKNYQRIFD